MTRVQFATLPVGSMFVAGDGQYEKVCTQSYDGITYNAKDIRRGDLWIFDDNDVVLDVTTSLVK